MIMTSFTFWAFKLPLAIFLNTLAIGFAISLIKEVWWE
jgi:hypothetical protein